MNAKIVTVFNNKGGVGKTTLTYHLAHALGLIGKRVLLVDLDPQCNLTINAMPMYQIEDMWRKEDPFMEDFQSARDTSGPSEFGRLLSEPRSIHFLLKPTEDGTADLDELPPPIALKDNVHILPGRLTLHTYEAKVGERFSGVYIGDPLAIRTATKVRALAHAYSSVYKYDVVIFDTSPSLGALNRNLLTLADGFLIPCSPDLFSLYGIKNIGSALRGWRKQFETIFHFLSDQKRSSFPSAFVRFMGYTIYNAKRYSKHEEDSLKLAKAHSDYAKQIPAFLAQEIDADSRLNVDGITDKSIGNNAVIHTHNTYPSMSQKYHVPMWELPDFQYLDPDDKSSIGGNQQLFRDTKPKYIAFANDFAERLVLL